MTRTHTPGPWRVGDAGNTIFGPPNGNPSPQTIAHLSVIDHAANARLIAAAPEMLEALRDALECLLDDDEGYMRPIITRLRSVIARAEGRAET